MFVRPLCFHVCRVAPRGRARAECRLRARCRRATSAASLGALDVRGVVAFVESLGIAAADSGKLSEQEVGGAAMLGMTEDKLRSYGVRGGPADTIMRAIADASAVEFALYPPHKTGGPNNPVKVRLTPVEFRVRCAQNGGPLRLSKGGVAIKEVVSLEQAVEELRQNPTARLHLARDDLSELRGFVANAAYALERATTRALALDASLAAELGQLTMVNNGESFSVSLRSGGKLLRQMEIDGLLAGARGAVLNSAKSTPTADHAIDVVADARKLQGMLESAEGAVTTNPAGVKEQLVSVSRIVPVLSGNYFTSAVEDACVKNGVSFVRPSGEGYAVTLVTVAQLSERS